jgi:hypothetical protein
MKKFFPRKHQEKKLLMTSIPFVSTVIRSIRLVLNETDREKFAATKKCLSIKEKQNKILKHFRSSLSVHKKDSSRISLKKKSINFIVSTVKSELKNELEADNSIGELLNEEIFGLVCELFVDYCADWTGGIGIVFAGYGEEDLYPSVKCLEIDTILDGCIKYRFNKINEFSVEEEIDEEKNLNVSKVIHYAQADEMTELFMHGITWGFRYYIIEKIEEKLKDASIKNADKILDEIENSIEDYSADTFYYPMNDFLFGLPRDELADMAEMLVKLTAFRQRVSSDGQSVGEPIDVAVISKSDGFVWHKKKESLTKR